MNIKPSTTGSIWTDLLLMDEVLPEAALPDFALEVFVLMSFNSKVITVHLYYVF